MPVHGAGDILRLGPELDSQHAFCNHICRPRSDDVHTQDPIGFFMGQDLDKSFCFSHTAGTPCAGERIRS